MTVTINEQVKANAKPDTKPNTETLSPKQKNAALLLASGLSKKEVAKTVEVEPHTISAWSKNPIFTCLINMFLSNVEQEVVLAMKSYRLKALDTLSELMSEDHPPTVRVMAAKALLTMHCSTVLNTN